MKKSNLTPILIAVIVVLVAALAFTVLNTPKKPANPLANAVEDIGARIEAAGKDMDTDRSPGAKMGDALEDAGKRLRDMTK